MQTMAIGFGGRWLAGVAALATALFLSVAPAQAGTKEAEAFVRQRGADAIKVLSTPGLTDQQYIKEFYDFVDRSFDVPAMAQFALGVYWRQANEAQRAEYLKLYRDYFVGTYAARFRTFSGENFEVSKSCRNRNRSPMRGRFSSLLRLAKCVAG